MKQLPLEDQTSGDFLGFLWASSILFRVNYLLFIWRHLKARPWRHIGNICRKTLM